MLKRIARKILNDADAHESVTHNPVPWRNKDHCPDAPVPKGAMPTKPPPPPSRIFHENGKETKQSIRDREDWYTYMAGYKHGYKNTGV